MTLSAALVALAPSDGDVPASLCQQRNAAIEVVWGELRRRAPAVARRFGADADDLAQDVVQRLIRRGPGIRGQAVSSDGEARGYLTRCLMNRAKDGLKRRGDRPPVLSLTAGDDDPGIDPKDTAPTVLEVLVDQTDTARQQALTTAARDALYARAVPAIAQSLQQGDGFLRNIEDIRRLSHEPEAMTEIVAREQQPGETFVRARNRIYQRQKRARAYALDRLDGWLQREALSTELDAVVRAMAQHEFAPRIDRRSASPDAQESQA